MVSEQKKAFKAILWGIAASFFLSSTFIINSLLSTAGGNWAWTAGLRSIFLIPVIAIVLLANRQLKKTLQAVVRYPVLFLKWGIIVFGVLYTALALAALWSPGWMVAATFQINILAGILLAPFIYPDHRRIIPKKALMITLVILGGVFIMQFDKLSSLHGAGGVLLSFVLVLMGAIIWPLGNRKLLVDLEHHGIELNALQRVLGMTIGCMPLLVVLSVIGYVQAGPPPFSQCSSSFLSALFAGMLGGAGFYQATQMVSKNTVALAAIEATQVLEILFTLIGEMVLKGTHFPGFYAQAGFTVIMIGLLVHFWNTWRHSKTLVSNEPVDVTAIDELRVVNAE